MHRWAGLAAAGKTELGCMRSGGQKRKLVHQVNLSDVKPIVVVGSWEEGDGDLAQVADVCLAEHECKQRWIERAEGEVSVRMAGNMSPITFLLQNDSSGLLSGGCMISWRVFPKSLVLFIFHFFAASSAGAGAGWRPTTHITTTTW